jgi:hypothetical protein
MSKYTKISIWYLVCILAGLGGAWSEGVPYVALAKTGIFSACVVAGIFIAMIIHGRREERKHGRRRPE